MRKQEASGLSMRLWPEETGAQVGSESEPLIQKRRTWLQGRDGEEAWKKTGVGKIWLRKGPEPQASGWMSCGAKRQPGFGRCTQHPPAGMAGALPSRCHAVHPPTSAQLACHSRRHVTDASSAPRLVTPAFRDRRAELSTGGRSEGALCSAPIQKPETFLGGRMHAYLTWE